MIKRIRTPKGIIINIPEGIDRKPIITSPMIKNITFWMIDGTKAAFKFGFKTNLGFSGIINNRIIVVV